MGIARFFNTLKKEFNIIKPIPPESKPYIKCDYFFIDFNSIIHVVSQRVNALVNKALMYSLMESNGCAEGQYLDYLKMLNLEDKFDLSINNEKKIIQQFNDYFTKERLDQIIIVNVGNFLLNTLKKCDNKIKFIYLSIDGVPSKAKMVEQKKRRFVGNFEKNMKKIILKKHKYKLDIDKNKDCKVPFNQYKYLQNKINWGKGNISPATYFMFKLSRYLTTIKFKEMINKILPKIRSDNIVLSSYNEIGEGEKKIVDYINNPDNNVNGNICIFSPDADLILLSMILKNKNINKFILRNDQQKSEKIENVYDSYYDLIKIDILENELFNYLKNKDLDKQNVLNDIVFIFTFFGDDFLHKVESYNVRRDIELILDIYKSHHNENSYILKLINGKFEIDYSNFIKLLDEMTKHEDYLIKKNYYERYKNFNYLSKKINSIFMKNSGLSVINSPLTFDSDKNIDIIKLINEYNFNQNMKRFVKNIRKIFEKFITIDVKPKKLSKSNITIININQVPINYFLNFYNNNNKLITKILNNGINTVNLVHLIKSKLDNNIFFNDLFKSNNLHSIVIRNKYKSVKNINNLDKNQMIDLLVIYYYIYTSLPLKLKKLSILDSIATYDQINKKNILN